MGAESLKESAPAENLAEKYTSSYVIKNDTASTIYLKATTNALNKNAVVVHGHVVSPPFSGGAQFGAPLVNSAKELAEELCAFIQDDLADHWFVELPPGESFTRSATVLTPFRIHIATQCVGARPFAIAAASAALDVTAKGTAPAMTRLNTMSLGPVGRKLRSIDIPLLLGIPAKGLQHKVRDTCATESMVLQETAEAVIEKLFVQGEFQVKCGKTHDAPSVYLVSKAAPAVAAAVTMQAKLSMVVTDSLIHEIETLLKQEKDKAALAPVLQHKSPEKHRDYLRELQRTESQQFRARKANILQKYTSPLYTLHDDNSDSFIWLWRSYNKIASKSDRQKGKSPLRGVSFSSSPLLQKSQAMSSFEGAPGEEDETMMIGIEDLRRFFDNNKDLCEELREEFASLECVDEHDGNLNSEEIGKIFAHREIDRSQYNLFVERYCGKNKRLSFVEYCFFALTNPHLAPNGSEKVTPHPPNSSSPGMNGTGSNVAHKLRQELFARGGGTTSVEEIMRQKRWSSLWQQFDTLNNGKISKQEFRRAYLVMDNTVSFHEFESEWEQFASSSGSGKDNNNMNFLEFCSWMEHIEANYGIKLTYWQHYSKFCANNRHMAFREFQKAYYDYEGDDGNKDALLKAWNTFRGRKSHKAEMEFVEYKQWMQQVEERRVRNGENILSRGEGPKHQLGSMSSTFAASQSSRSTKLPEISASFKKRLQ